ncbi:peptide/nickel transport system ATP-binding protein [Microbacterium sp. cf046]|uniref:dipeptide ABC transporter ATP-binding protein n=1 Tax=Microbacterium sp. cf046 TaxID=1761803 RepID=UPI0008EE6371|nr:ABC transporter ATP-binding protein [Microbacterium sp. cf046]SFS17582.1 peptide/nickel transport system ATP-binding protein [Microbacterium sp. cf046]
MSAGQTDPIIDIRGLAVDYRRDGRVSHALRGIDLRVARGERVAIVGESGSGKSTAALALLGLLPHTGHVVAGSAKVAGVELAGASERIARGIRGRIVGLVPQDPTVSLNPTHRIGHQVAEAVRLRGVPKPYVDAAVVEALEQAGIDDPVARAQQYPHELSGGLRQRVLIAIALAGDPDVIVADEPTSALDVTVQRRILDHLDALVRERGIALVIITHDLGVAADRADRVVVLQDGLVVEHGPAVEVLAAPEHSYTKRLVTAAPGLVSVVPPRKPEAATPVLLRWEAVTKDFPLPRGAASPALRAVDRVSLEAHSGRTLAIVGESGSGKTTLLRIALGLEKPTEGRVVFDGSDITRLGWREARPLRRRFQLVQQNPFASLDPRFTIGRSVAEPLVSFGIGSRRTRRARVAELLDLVALPADAADRRPSELSGGQRQRAAIARALAVEPELLYLDEPVSALDVSVQDQVLRLLARLQADLGVGYVLVSHDLGVVAQVAHEVAVVRGGRVLERGTAARVLSAPEHEYTRALLDAVPGRTLREAVA